MRWKEPYWEQKRIIRKFLFFPKKINGETRWLEFTNIKQSYEGIKGWKDLGWIDKKEYDSDI